MPDNINTRKDASKNRDANPDPITGAPGAHPVGTGVGAAAGGAAGVAGGMAAGAAAGTAGAGPIGGAIGAVVGAVVGGLAGKGVAEHINPTEEDAYWREHHTKEPYYDRTYGYDDYRGAYRTGYEGYSRLGQSGKRYEDIEPELRRDYERNFGTSRLGWDKARAATRAAWHRLEGRTHTAGSDVGGVSAESRDLSQFVGYDVVDRNGNSIGTLDCIWADHTGEPAFVGVRTGWFLGKTHVVPAESVEVSEQGHRLRLPYSDEKVKNAPAYDADYDMTDEKEREIYAYYGLTNRSSGFATGSTGMSGSTAAGMAGSSTATSAADRAGMVGDTARRTSETERRTDRTGQDQATLRLAEEQLRIGKREVEAGGIRLRKIVRTEMVNQPVELRREEVIIERVPTTGGAASTQGSFTEQEVYIPLRREEAVVEKEVRVREEVRAHKESQTDTQQVTERVRREDVDIERTGEAKERTRRDDRKT